MPSTHVRSLLLALFAAPSACKKHSAPDAAVPPFLDCQGYPGDGRCGMVPSLKLGCVLGERLLGRWTYTCETTHPRDIDSCEGTRLSDASPRDQICQSFCGPGEKEQLACRPRPSDMPPPTRRGKAWPSVTTP